MAADTAERERQDADLQHHLSECVECWEDLAEQEEWWGIDMRLPEHPEFTTDEARRAHDR